MGIIWTAHLSELRIENLLSDYWEAYSRVERNITRAIYDDTNIFWYWPSCPEVNAEG